MKRLLLFLLFPLSIYAQEPPKKASKIIILVKDSGNILLKKVALALFDRGFTIDTKDDQLKLLTTKERPSKKYNTQTKIRVSINDTSIVFTSTIALGFEMTILGMRQAPTFDPVTYSGAKKSPMREAWNELYDIAKQFGDRLIYSK